MSNKVNTAASIVLVVGAAIIGRTLFPVTKTVVAPPVIVTVRDTVKSVDTLFIRRIKTDTLWLTRVSVTPPETVKVAPPLTGLVLLSVGEHVGDSTIAQGFNLAPIDTGYTVHLWRATWWTPGPLRAIRIVGQTPQAAFWSAPEVVKPCKFFCKVSHYVVAGGSVWAACKIGILQC
jgi:hypothetical protein